MTLSDPFGQVLRAPVKTLGPLGAAGYCTTRVAVVERPSEPDVPVMVILNVPVGVPGLGAGVGEVESPPPQATWSASSEIRTPTNSQKRSFLLGAWPTKVNPNKSTPGIPSQSA